MNAGSNVRRRIRERLRGALEGIGNNGLQTQAVLLGEVSKARMRHEGRAPQSARSLETVPDSLVTATWRSAARSRGGRRAAWDR